MSDDLHRRIQYTGRKWRRKRSVQGKDWAPPTMQDVKSGVWCPACHKRHSYNGSSKLVSQFERRGAAWVLLWLCPFTGDVVGELWTGDVNFPDGQRALDAEKEAGADTSGAEGPTSGEAQV